MGLDYLNDGLALDPEVRGQAPPYRVHCPRLSNDSHDNAGCVQDIYSAVRIRR